MTGSKKDYKWNKLNGLIKIKINDGFISTFNLSMGKVFLEKLAEVWNVMSTSKIYGSYKQFLLERTHFKSYCCTVIDTSTEVVFNKFLSNDNVETEEQINIHCQALMTQIFICYETSMSNAKSKTMCNFWGNIMAYLKGDGFSEMMNQLPKDLQSRRLWVVIVFNLIHYFDSEVIKVCDRLKISQNIAKETQVYSLGDERTEVQRFIGWAIYSYRKRLLEKENSSQLDDAKMDLLSHMITSADEVKDNQEYLMKCYSLEDQIYNRGHLTLVSEKFFRWAKKLNQVIKIYINVK